MKLKSCALLLSILPLALTASANANNNTAAPITAQLTVWNQSGANIKLVCTTEQGVTINPAELTIAINESPAIFLTSNHYGDLARCHVDGASATFKYTLVTADQEYFEIPQLPSGEPNFHYDHIYPGALIYQ